MRKLFLSAGHSPTEPGAWGNGYKEELLAIGFRDILVTELKALGVNPTIDDNSNALKKTLAYFKNMVSSDSIVVDIHWNSSSNPTATGVETLIPAEYSSFEYKLASLISSEIANTLGIRMRGTNGVKTEADSHHGRLGWMRLNGENILIEMCFISNASDMQKYQQNKYNLAKNLAVILKAHLTK